MSRLRPLKKAFQFFILPGLICLTAYPTSAGTIGTTVAAPVTAVVGVATPITVTSVITDTSVIPSSVVLQSLDSSGRVIAILGNLHDDGLNGDAVAGDHTFSIQSTVYQTAPGPVTFRVSAGFKGSLLRASSAPVVVNVTGTSIGLEILSPANLAYVNTSPINVSGNVGDPAAQVSINGINAPVTSGQFLATIPLVEGLNTLTAVANNTGGVISSASVQVTLDTTPPHITIDSPADGSTTTAASLTISGTANDVVVGTVNSGDVQVTVNGIAALVANRTYSVANVPLALGPNTIQAAGRDRAGNGTTASITVTRTAAGQPLAVAIGKSVVTYSLGVVSGNNQTGTIGAQLPAPLVVALTDSLNNAVPNQSVVFQVTGNNGTVAGGGPGAPSVAVNTDSNGQAQVLWTLGQRSGAGINTLEASSALAVGPANFSAAGLTANAAQINVDSGNNQTGVLGQPLAFPFVAVVTDSGHNRVPNIQTTFTVKQGGGNFGGLPSQTLTTDGNGRAIAVLTLGTQPGNSNNVVEANFAGNPSLPAAFAASAKAPGNPASTTISGVVLDNSNNAIQAVTIRLFLTNQGNNNNLPVQIGTPVQTDTQGTFLIQPAPVGFFKLMADGTTAIGGKSYPTLEYDIVTVAGQDNTVGMPIYLPALDTVNQLCVDETHGGTLTLPSAPGFSLTVLAGSATFPGGSRTGCLTVTPVNGDKVPMAPGFGQQPRFIVTIQPVGTTFNPPAPITIPNVDGLKPKAVTEMYSYDHDLSMFVAIGTGTVSNDGSVIASNPGVGVLKAGWHCGGDPNSSGAAGGIRVTARPNIAFIVKEGTTTITAGGTPPLEGTYSWSSDDPTIADVVGPVAPPNCNNQSSCQVQVKGNGIGATQVRVTFLCTTTGISDMAAIPVTVAEIKNITFQNQTMGSPREIDQAYKYVAVYTGTSVTFSFTTDPPNTVVPAGLISWSGAASGSNQQTLVQFGSSGSQVVTLTAQSVQKSANIQVVDTPTGIGEIAWAALDPIDTAIALVHNLIGNNFTRDYLWMSPLEPVVWTHTVFPSDPGGYHNDKADAARHTYWMCLLTGYTSPTYASGVGFNHEVSGEPSPSTETIMDLTNNANGIGLGKSLVPFNTFTPCQTAVLSALAAGSLVYMDQSYGLTDTTGAALLQPSNK